MTEQLPTHAQQLEAIQRELETNLEHGLTREEAGRRLDQFGPNELIAAESPPWYTILLRQFTDALIGILIAAAVVSAAVGEVGDAATILAIVVLNGVLGFVQEWRAEKAMASLHRMLAPRTRVIRDGELQEIDASEVVSGDLVSVEMGDRVPADLRMVSTHNLKIDESALTGESKSSTKKIEALPATTPLAERRNIAFMGTAVDNGRGTGLVVATGMQTEFGRIADLTQSVGAEPTPLQHKLSVLGKQLGAISIATAVLVALAGVATGKPHLEMFLIAVALAVAVVPEGLPAVVTITLALGLRAMLKRKALLRRLQAAEALGSASVICSDKTGTLTQNQMTVQEIWLPSGPVKVTGVGYDPAGHFEVDGEVLDYASRADLLRLLTIGRRCSHATIRKTTDGAWQQTGEPTEAALVVAAHKAWLENGDDPLVAEISFSSARKRMTTVLGSGDQNIAYVKGAPEVVLERCTHILVGEQVHPLDDTWRTKIHDAQQALSHSGLRTLALADRVLPPDLPLTADHIESSLTWIGVVGIIDPARAEVPAAIEIARHAGIRTLMITGDAPGTALAIAKRVGLKAERAVVGADIDALDEPGLAKLVQEPVLFARTTPEHKLRIVRALQSHGQIVAMTGDGVNDAPALKQAEIGIAMGLRGTEVARAAADMILTDDNYASIVGAVEEGRRQYANIQKFVRYLLSSNTGEVIAIAINIAMGGPLLLLPVQILWMNLVTDGMTAVALGLEPVAPDAMHQPPTSPKARVLNLRAVGMILALGGYMAAATLWLFHTGADHVADLDHARTLAFTGLVVLEKVNVFNFRALRLPLWRVGWFTNRWLWLALATTLMLQMLAVYAPPFQKLLHTTALAPQDWLLIGVTAIPLFIIPEALKWLTSRRPSAQPLPTQA